MGFIRGALLDRETVASWENAGWRLCARLEPLEWASQRHRGDRGTGRGFATGSASQSVARHSH